MPDNSREAIALLDRAIEAEPQYGRAHALLAWCHSREIVYLWSTNQQEKFFSGAQTAIDATANLINYDPTALAAVGAVISQCMDASPRGPPPM